jgi:hypothetical protein
VETAGVEPAPPRCKRGALPPELHPRGSKTKPTSSGRLQLEMWKRRAGHPSKSDEPVYRLGELGWLQFERLCTEVLELESGVRADQWRGHADQTRTALIADGLKDPITGDALPGSVLAIACWMRPRQVSAAAQLKLLRETATTILENEARTGTKPHSVLLLTNLDTTGLTQTHDGLTLQVLGSRELGAIVDRSMTVRRRLPSVLGVRDLSQLITAELVQRSSADLDAAQALARVFVPTHAYAQTLAVLEHHCFAVLTGPPEMGKTAIARMVALAQLTCGWEAHECIRPDELWHRFAPDRAQIFIADDAFGSTEYRPEAAERWALELDRVLRAMDQRHWLIWTSRPAPLKAGLRRIHREHGTERFPQPAEVQVAAGGLETEEKALILFRHARASCLGDPAIALVLAHGWQIVEHPHFTPERIRRFVSDRLPQLSAGGPVLREEIGAAVNAEIREPTQAMTASLQALGSEHRALLVALLDVPQGPAPEREVAAAVRRHSESGFPRPPHELVDRLTDHFVRVIPPTSVVWVHPSWRDLVIDAVAADTEERRRFLDHCSLEGILLALSVGGGAAGERTMPLLIDDADWDLATDRIVSLIDELADPDLFRLVATLGEAIDAVRDGHARTEIQALASVTLERIRKRWEVAHAPISVSLLDAWLMTASRLAEPPTAPDVTATWVELVPTRTIDLRSPSELDRLEEWVSLVAALAGTASERLTRFDFPHAQLPFLKRLIDEAGTLIAEGEEFPETHEMLGGLLRRLAHLPALPPGVAIMADTAAANLGVPSEPRRERRRREWEESQPTAERSIVTRVLRDLASR